MTLLVAVICGGRSSEHEVSCISAGGVISAIDRSKFEPILIGITKGGHWVLLPEDSSLTISDGNLPEVVDSAQRVVVDVAGFSVAGKDLKIDLVFPLLHGPYGEDGTIQGLLEMANLPYVGSGVLASAVAMDKSFAKPIFSAQEMATVAGIVLKANQWLADPGSVLEQVKKLGYPVFVKPARGGSSRGTSKVHSETELATAIETALQFDPKVMIEEAIVGSEIECAVLEIAGEPQASVVGRISIDPKFEFYDFEAKYLDGATSIELPAAIPPGIAEEIRTTAIKAFQALGCSGLARVDFFLTDTGKIIINELNTMPGFTATSVFPKMWQASGVSYTEVISHLIEGALLRRNGVLGN